MKYLVWHITHGVQTTLEEGYAQKHIERVRKNIPDQYLDYIVPVVTNWSSLLEERQRRTWEMESDLSLSKIRRIAVSIACDLLWYDEPWVNEKIHKIHDTDLTLALDPLIEKGLLGGIVRQGHSLGSQIMLDASHRSLHKSRALITLGSPITKYSGKFDGWGSLPAGLSAWLNLYANRDLVASSFRNFPRQDFRDTIRDERISSWNPLNWPLFRAHTFYWQDSDVCRLIANFLTNQLRDVN